MGRINTEGLDKLINDLAAAAAIPDSTMQEMLRAEAEIVTEAHKQSIESEGLVDTHQLANSIQEGPYKNRSIEIWPQGNREDGTRNAEVGFINEFGAPGRKVPYRRKRPVKGAKNAPVPASHWMEHANEKSADKAAEAAEKVYDSYLKQHNL